MTPSARGRVAATLLTVAAAAASCAERKPGADDVRFEVSRSTSSHGLSVSVFVSRQQIGIADRLEVLIEARSADGQPVRWPDTLAGLERGAMFPPAADESGAFDWSVVDLTRRVLAPGHEAVELVLEPYLDGEKPIPAFTFRIGASSLATEPVPVRVVAEHALDATAADDPLGALATLNAPLPPPDLGRPWFMQPLAWTVGGMMLVMLLGGSGALAIARSRRRRRQPSPDDRLAQLLTLGRFAADSPDPSALGDAAEKSVGGLRTWLAATGRLAPGATGPEAIAWIRASAASAAAGLGQRLESYEQRRFAPGTRVERADLLGLIDSIAAFTRELRESAAHKVSDVRVPGGGAAA